MYIYEKVPNFLKMKYINPMDRNVHQVTAKNIQKVIDFFFVSAQNSLGKPMSTYQQKKYT